MKIWILYGDELKLISRVTKKKHPTTNRYMLEADGFVIFAHEEEELVIKYFDKITEAVMLGKRFINLNKVN